MSVARRRSESGFTLIEVIIAVFILAIVAGAVTLTISSSTRAGQGVKVKDRQRAIASGVLNRVISNRDWIKTYSCGVGDCTISGFIPASDPLLREPEGTVVHQVTIIATGVDLPNDGIDNVGTGDADKQVPDVYRIAVDVATTVGAESAQIKDYSVGGTLDMSVRATTGVLRVRACEVSVQADERIAVGLCDRGTMSLPIAPPGASTAPCPTAVTIAAATPECGAWRQAVATGNPDITTMQVAPISTSFTLKGPMSESSPPTQTITTNASGVTEVADLAPGRYEITAASSSTRVLWNSHSVPSGGEVTIRAGEVNDAVQMFRLAARTVTIDLEHLDISDPNDHQLVSVAKDSRSIKLIPVPNGRAALANGADRGWTKISPGDPEVVMKDVAPGLYQMMMLEYPGKAIASFRSSTPGQRYIWVPPVGGTQSPTTLSIRDTYCHIPTRNALRTARITPTQIALGMAATGFVWINPSGVEVWHGPCAGDNPDGSSSQVTGEAGA